MSKAWHETRRSVVGRVLPAEDLDLRGYNTCTRANGIHRRSRYPGTADFLREQRAWPLRPQRSWEPWPGAELRAQRHRTWASGRGGDGRRRGPRREDLTSFKGSCSVLVAVGALQRVLRSPQVGLPVLSRRKIKLLKMSLSWVTACVSQVHRSDGWGWCMKPDTKACVPVTVPHPGLLMPPGVPLTNLLSRCFNHENLLSTWGGHVVGWGGVGWGSGCWASA